MKRVFLVLIVLAVFISGIMASGDSEVSSEIPFEDRFLDMTWDEIVAEADGQKMYYFAWGGHEPKNRWHTGFVADRLKELYNIDFVLVPLTGGTEFVNQVLGEKQAGKHTDGSVDLMWINGEDFYTMKKGDLLFGPYLEYLPNMKYYNPDDPTLNYDFGYDIDGYESPFGKAQSVIIYNSAEVPSPPASIPELVAWIKENPGKFTYPALPDFTATMFIKNLLYYIAGGVEKFPVEFSQEAYDELAPKLWDLLNEIEPYLWRRGEIYPESLVKLQELYSNGEVHYCITAGSWNLTSFIESGRFPASSRTFVFDIGTIGDCNYVAIPYNSSKKAAAMVAANFIMGPEAQYSHLDNVKVIPMIEIALLSEEWKEKFTNYPVPEHLLPVDVLQEHMLPSQSTAWTLAIEKGWKENVLIK